MQQLAHAKSALPIAHTHVMTMMSITIIHAEPEKTKKKNATMEIPAKTPQSQNAILLLGNVVDV